MLTLTPLLLVFPLAGFVILGLFARLLPRVVVSTIGCGVILLAFLVALGNFFTLGSATIAGQTASVEQIQWNWVTSGGLQIPFGLLVDHLSAIMMLVVTGVGLLIHVYSIGYMAEERPAAYARYFSFMNLFIFMMSLLVLANTFLFLLVGWAGVGLASFLLIGFWYTRPSAVAAAQKAFVINVIGDFGLMLAIFLMVGKFNTLNYSGTIFPHSGAAFSASDMTTTAIALLLLVAAAAKSAQLPLHVWLPDAMEGPTPVSALIHAATMVTAGVYLVARSHVIFEAAPIATIALAVMGGASAFYAATSALFQYDIKRVLAYSTMSQLGYMFMGESVGADSAAIFHLMTHAFFKALLFMAAGGVIHALHGEQDMRKMGGLRSQLPVTYWSFIIGGLALAGIVPFAGFWSKDAILSAILAQAQTQQSVGLYALWLVGLATAFLTGLYIFRLIFTVFHGEPRARFEHVHEVGTTMAAPMVILLVLATVGGFVGTPFADAIGGYLKPATTVFQDHLGGQSLGTELVAILVALVMGLAGIALAWQRYGRQPALFTANSNPVYQLFAHAYYLDPLFNAAIAQPVLMLGRGFNTVIERWTLDGGSLGVATLVGWFSRSLRRTESGYARNYALAIVFGAVVIVGAYIVAMTR